MDQSSPKEQPEAVEFEDDKSDITVEPREKKVQTQMVQSEGPILTDSLTNFDGLQGSNYKNSDRQTLLLNAASGFESKMMAMGELDSIDELGFEDEGKLEYSRNHRASRKVNMADLEKGTELSTLDPWKKGQKQGTCLDGLSSKATDDQILKKLISTFGDELEGDKLIKQQIASSAKWRADKFSKFQFCLESTLRFKALDRSFYASLEHRQERAVVEKPKLQGKVHSFIIRSEYEYGTTFEKVVVPQHTEVYLAFPLGNLSRHSETAKLRDSFEAGNPTEVFCCFYADEKVPNFQIRTTTGGQLMLQTILEETKKMIGKDKAQRSLVLFGGPIFVFTDDKGGSSKGKEEYPAMPTGLTEEDEPLRIPPLDEVEIKVEFRSDDEPQGYNLKRLVDTLGQFQPTDSMFHRTLFRKYDDLQVQYLEVERAEDNKAMYQSILLNSLDCLTLECGTSKKVWDHFYNSQTDLEEYSSFLSEKGISSTDQKLRQTIFDLKKESKALSKEGEEMKETLSSNQKVIKIMLALLSACVVLVIVFGTKLSRANSMNEALNEINALQILFRQTPALPKDDDRTRREWLQLGPFDLERISDLEDHYTGEKLHWMVDVHVPFSSIYGNGTYTGQMISKEGTYSWLVSSELIPEGLGRWIDDNYNNFYEGEWKQGQAHGFGRFFYSTGGYYEGEFKEGRMDGKGKRVYSDGRSKEGEFKNGYSLGGN